ncbi:MAG: AmmeMemoRadiSam system protein B [Bacteroidales bacterium]|nr:AmmeMemoRadiSam system protein B [Bacteroidales bacterium]
MKIRKPEFAGSFYPSTSESIDEIFHQVLKIEKSRIQYKLSEYQIIGGIVPHAEYHKSAFETLHFFEILAASRKTVDTVIILNPSHTGLGGEVSLDEHDAWESPYGTVEIDQEFYNHLAIEHSPYSQTSEHSGEVILPYLQKYIKSPFKIVPITICYQNLMNARKVADLIIQANRKLHRRLLLVASSDFSHHLPPEIGQMKDNLVLDKILKMDSEGIYQSVLTNKVSICGFGPIMVLNEYTRKMASHPEVQVLRRGNSGDVKPSRNVVDYISIIYMNKHNNH